MVNMGGAASGVKPDKAWNSSLSRRKTPMKRKKGDNWKRSSHLKKTPLKKVSKSQRRRLAEYQPEQRAYLRLHPDCEICIARGIHPPRPATEVHHARGRAGKLISDSRFFKASCRYCREWPHENPREARALGVLAEASNWNVSPR